MREQRQKVNIIIASGESAIEDGSTSAAIKDNTEKEDELDKEMLRSALNSVPRAIPIITS